MTKTNETLNTSEPREAFNLQGENHVFSERKDYFFIPKKTNKSRRGKYTKPDLIKVCFICDDQVKVKYNLPRKKYSQKNLGGYGTEKPTDQHKYICNSCLKKKLLGEFKEGGVSREKSVIFHVYLARNWFV